MENEKLGQEPAFPTVVGFENGKPVDSFQVGNNEAQFSGISKRFYAACAAMQGIVANADVLRTCAEKAIANKCEWYSIVAENAYGIADELLKQENQK